MGWNVIGPYPLYGDGPELPGRCHQGILPTPDLIWVGLMMLYTAGLVTLLYAFGLWNASLLKDTVYWFCFVAPTLAYRFLSSQANENVVSRIFADNVKITVVLEFVIAAFVYPLAGELVLTIIVLITVLARAVAQTDQRFAALESFTTTLLVVIGFFLLSHAVTRALGDQDFWALDTLNRIVLPLLLSILFAPFIYLMLVCTSYESLFVLLRAGPGKSEDLRRYAKRRLIRHLGLKPANIRAFQRAHHLDLIRMETRDDLDRFLRE